MARAFDRIRRASGSAPGSISLDITINGKTLEGFKLLKSVSRGFAAKALTEVAKDSVPAWRAQNDRAFYMRRRAFVQGGVRYVPAEKDTLTAQVGTIDKFAGRHVIGIDQPKVSAARGLFVPVYASITDALTHTRTRTKLDQMKGTGRAPFKIESRSGKILIVRRKTSRRTPLEILGVIQPDVHVEPRVDALGAVDGVVQHRFGEVYERLLLQWWEKNNSAR